MKVPAAHRAVGGMKKLGLSQKQWGAEGFRHAEAPSCPEMGAVEATQSFALPWKNRESCIHRVHAEKFRKRLSNHSL